MTYIPRSSLVSNNSQGAIPKVVQKRHTFRVFGFLAGFLLTASLLSAAGTFFYREYALNQLTSEKEALTKESASDNAKNIAEINAFNTRLNTAHNLLNNHISPSQVFERIEQITKQSVQLTEFKYTYDPGFDAFLEIGGATSELSSVALQKIELLKTDMFSKVVLQGITLVTKNDDTVAGSGGDVQFNVKGILQKQLFAYTGAAATLDAISPDLESVTGEAVPAEVDNNEGDVIQ